ncbi:hypothetical protein GPDM_04909 [Planococcus donghaensis MPA1U2]|uniref:Lipoprotein n=1 Tax=Planococcus donghaensis MPA1U2 TaxID=933115 RepID=E7REU2_9BACL|nr:hypothetical protein [Planococcus donghaensis]EGA90478.1 hypothetical protein GPDM_04909 [Planococcus donghaensis MPA1U2]
MKKLWAIGLSATFLLTACSEEEATEPKETATSTDTSDDTSEVKKEMMKFYMSIPNTINAVDADLNKFEMDQAEEALPEGEELQQMKDAAISASNEAVNAVDSLEIPETLKDQEEQITSAFASMRESYELKAEELSKETPSFEEANEKFNEADAQLNEILEELGLAASSIYNEVSQ